MHPTCVGDRFCVRLASGFQPVPTACLSGRSGTSRNLLLFVENNEKNCTLRTSSKVLDGDVLQNGRPLAFGRVLHLLQGGVRGLHALFQARDLRAAQTVQAQADGALLPGDELVRAAVPLAAARRLKRARAHRFAACVQGSAFGLHLPFEQDLRLQAHAGRNGARQLRRVGDAWGATVARESQPAPSAAWMTLFYENLVIASVYQSCRFLTRRTWQSKYLNGGKK